MKRLISVVMCILMIFSAFAFAVNAEDNTKIYRSGDYKYTVLKDGSVEINQYLGNDTHVKIPSKLDGKKVTSIEAAFANRSDLISVIIPNGVKRIGSNSFMWCDHLESVKVPDSVKEIDDLAFQNCFALTDVRLPDGITKIAEGTFIHCYSLKKIEIPDTVKSIGRYAFKTCKSLKSITIPNNVTKIGAGAFANCKSLEKIKIGNKVNSIVSTAFDNTKYVNTESNWTKNALYIGNYLIDVKESIKGKYTVKDGTRIVPASVFNKCKSLTSIVIPKSVISLGAEPFRACFSLESIKVESGNKKYTSVDGVLYNKAMTNLMRYPAAKKTKTFSVPESVKVIDSFAFYNNSYVQKVNLGKNVKSIGISAFYNCMSIKTMTIPKTVENISEDAGIGRYNAGTADTGDTIEKTVPGFVLKGYKGSAADEYQSCVPVKFVTLCKNGKDHKTVDVKAKKATYFSAGWKKHKQCTVCGEKIDYQEVTKVLKVPDDTKITAGKGKITVKYSAVKDATGFEVKYITNKTAVKKTYVSSKSVTKTIKNLKKGEYKVYVRAVVEKNNKKAYSPWTYKRVVTVK